MCLHCLQFEASIRLNVPALLSSSARFPLLPRCLNHCFCFHNPFFLGVFTMRRKSDLITHDLFSFLHCLPPLPVIFILLLLPAPAAASSPIAHNCSGSQYNATSSFAASLAKLFSSLSSLSSSNYSASATARAGDSVAYGLYMCQGDLPGSECQSCVQNAIANVNQTCPDQSRGVLWYDLCELRYTDVDFFGVPDADGHNLTNPYERTSSNMPYEAVSELVRVVPLRKPMFATNASRMYPIFALAQCSADLSSDGCRTCLNASLAFIRDCCTRAKGWRFLAPSCWIRYESTPISGNPNTGYTEIIRSNCSTDGLSSDNLNSLLSDLKSRATSKGFYNASAGASGSEVYGLALCRKDPAQLPSGDCTDCIDTASSAIVNECPNKTEGIMWYDNCTLRYSNRNFFGLLDGVGQPFCSNEHVAAETDNITMTLAESLVQEAVKSSFLFAAGKAAKSDSDSSYVMVQCTRDLTSESCRSCLEVGMRTIKATCSESRGWQYLSGSCAIRYEVYAFFDETPIITPRPPEGNPSQGGQNKTSKHKVIAFVLPLVGVVLLGLLFHCGWKRFRRSGRKLKQDDFKILQDRDLTYMDLATVQMATKNFSDENKLGSGGFGPVYKGVLHDGKEIAVKRLSEKSKQGSSEFKNEVKLIAKLQHKNLVRLLGCCVQGEEKLLVYEYLPNKSLDFFLFDNNKRVELDWERRFLMILGIAKGLLYLHEDSLLKVIHRDLKASNVLLDKDMNPKISDFGMAKIYVPEESEVNTNRIVGTFGYMAPEYAMDGIFSAKSDVYSFGVLLIEIICGARNGREHLEQHGKNLPRRASDLCFSIMKTSPLNSVLTGMGFLERRTGIGDNGPVAGEQILKRGGNEMHQHRLAMFAGKSRGKTYHVHSCYDAEQ